MNLDYNFSSKFSCPIFTKLKFDYECGQFIVPGMLWAALPDPQTNHLASCLLPTPLH